MVERLPAQVPTGDRVGVAGHLRGVLGVGRPGDPLGLVACAAAGECGEGREGEDGAEPHGVKG
jgi:hypothetical protein